MNAKDASELTNYVREQKGKEALIYTSQQITNAAKNGRTYADIDCSSFNVDSIQKIQHWLNENGYTWTWAQICVINAHWD